MIPGILADFLDRASVAAAGTRDEGLVPSVHWVSGWSVHENRTDVVCLLAEPFAEGLVRRLERLPMFVLTAEVIGPHECYQYKGRYVDWRPAQAGDREVFERCFERYARDANRFLGGRVPRETFAATSRPPDLAVRFRVEEIFVQTPGPAAGQRIWPREGR